MLLALSEGFTQAKNSSRNLEGCMLPTKINMMIPSSKYPTPREFRERSERELGRKIGFLRLITCFRIQD